MRTVLGMVLGCVLTIFIVYLHDNTSIMARGDAGSVNNRPIVNWDVATGEWNRMTEQVRLSWDKLVNSERSRT